MGSRDEIQNERNSIIAALAKLPDGAMAKAIRSELDIKLSSVTLRRRLKSLHSDGMVEISGRSSGSRYKLSPDARVLEEEFSIQLSDEARETLKNVSRAIQARKPVSYSNGFLEDYHPNESFYLPSEDRSKLREIGETPETGDLAGTYARNILDRLMIDLSWNSSRLEGNTYSLLETQRLIEQGKEAEGRSAEEAQMILNHKRAIEFLVDSAGEIGFNRYTVCNLHALLSQNLLSDPMGEGRLRSTEVKIGGSVYEPTAIPQQIEECFDKIMAKAEAIGDPFEQSFFLLAQLPYLQPFIDVNKRVSRLAANIPLLRGNLSPLSFIGLNQGEYVRALLGVYELNRLDLLRETFMWAYENSANRYVAIRQKLGKPDPFRLSHRDSIYATVAEVVDNRSNQGDASKLVAERSGELPVKDREKFIEVVETEILALNEGNIARYRIRPSLFHEWQKVWLAE